ncbi:unnamed protein product [Brassica oleracea]
MPPQSHVITSSSTAHILGIYGNHSCPEAPSPPLPNWHDVLSAMRATTPLGPWRLLTLLTWQATIYFCWSERNSRLHRSAFRHRDLIKKDIDRVIRQKIAATRYSNPNLSSSLFQAWTV